MTTLFSGASLALLFASFIAGPAALAQTSGEGATLEEVIVTGSRIRRDPLNEIAPVMNIGADDLERSGLTNLGAALQQLPITGSAINTRFNVPGNSGFPQDGSGIGAGAVQLSLRNTGAKRTLVLVDGRRWIAGASASGVPSTVDLNSIPANVIERVEILQDGASAIYGSDAIGGVVNIITNRDFEGMQVDVHSGRFLSQGDGRDFDLSLLWGGGSEQTHIVFSAGYTEEGDIFTWDRPRSRFPVPDTDSCDVPGTRCSSFTPQGRFILGPNLGGGASITLNDGVRNDGGANIPRFNPASPGVDDDFHRFTGADRFNYNGPGFNYLRTPSQRVNLYTQVTHRLNSRVALVARAAYTKRNSDTRGAPEPLCLGSGCGNEIGENFFISKDNPYNPFGADLSVAAGTLSFFGRRPLESGPRLFSQNVDTYFVSAGFEGEFDLRGRGYYWDASLSYGDNQGFQEKRNSHNLARLQVAMGDPAVCRATPGCVPYNFFGGQGPDGRGSITREMRDFVNYTQRDFSEQTLVNIAANVGGDILALPAGDLAFAAGFEYRRHRGAFRPDPVAARGETAGIASRAHGRGLRCDRGVRRIEPAPGGGCPLCPAARGEHRPALFRLQHLRRRGDLQGGRALAGGPQRVAAQFRVHGPARAGHRRNCSAARRGKISPSSTPAPITAANWVPETVAAMRRSRRISSPTVPRSACRPARRRSTRSYRPSRRATKTSRPRPPTALPWAWCSAPTCPGPSGSALPSITTEARSTTPSRVWTRGRSSAPAPAPAIPSSAMPWSAGPAGASIWWTTSCAISVA